MLTTLTSYGAVSAHRHIEIMGELWTLQDAPAKGKSGAPSAETVAHVVTYLQARAS